MWFRVGLVVLVLSFVPWLAIAAAPLLGLSFGTGVGVVGASLLMAEVLFWAGLALAGKDTWRAVKAHGWLRAPRELVRLLVRGRPATPRTASERASAPLPQDDMRRPATTSGGCHDQLDGRANRR